MHNRAKSPSSLRDTILWYNSAKSIFMTDAIDGSPDHEDQQQNHDDEGENKQHHIVSLD